MALAREGLHAAAPFDPQESADDAGRIDQGVAAFSRVGAQHDIPGRTHEQLIATHEE